MNTKEGCDNRVHLKESPPKPSQELRHLIGASGDNYVIVFMVNMQNL